VFAIRLPRSNGGDALIELFLFTTSMLRGAWPDATAFISASKLETLAWWSEQINNQGLTSNAKASISQRLVALS
jgi:hypothetical protein